ncbi:unnamed protein product [Rotaria sordida]|uniref:Uncharacterized protein n=1 Tax=Rotaria sordida TaxID=392033 RepID=A0A819PMA1_9BILA|nr:unnamed protein product [Rotaria sordida]
MSSASTTPDLTCVRTGCDVAPLLSEESVTRMNGIIEQFKLIELPLESGLFQIIGNSSLQVSIPSRPSNSTLHAQSHIYYMLTSLLPNKPHLAYNYLHSIDYADDLHILVEGDSVDYYLFYDDGHVEHKILGHDYAAGEVPMITTPGTIASKALKLRHEKHGFAFISDLDKAIEAAEKDFQYDSPWRKLDPAARAQLIHKLAYLLPRVVDYLSTIMLALKLGSALVCGNVVILKPAEQTPLTALFYASAIKEVLFNIYQQSKFTLTLNQ